MYFLREFWFVDIYIGKSDLAETCERFWFSLIKKAFAFVGSMCFVAFHDKMKLKY